MNLQASRFRAPRRARFVVWLAASVAFTLLGTSPALAARQTTPAGDSTAAPKTHKPATAKHKPVPHHAHHSTAAHRAHSAAAARRAHTSAQAKAKPAPKAQDESAAPAAGVVGSGSESNTAVQAAHPAATPETAQPAPAQAATVDTGVTPQPAAAGTAVEQPATPLPAQQSAQQPVETAPATDAAQPPATAANPAAQTAPSQPAAGEPAPGQTSAGQPAAGQAAPATADSQSSGQAPAAAATVQEAPATESAAPPANQTAAAASAPVPQSFNFAPKGAATEEELRQLLVGKTLYLRGGYLDNTLTFDETGRLAGHSPIGSYTLSGIQIERVHLSKHKVELEGARYGLHFLGALPYEDPTKAVDRVKITPKKKFVKITIDRELLVTPKKKKEKGGEKNNAQKTGPGGLELPADSAAKTDDSAQQAANGGNAAAQPGGEQPANSTEPKPEDNAAAKPTATPDIKPETAAADKTDEQDATDQAKAEMASAPAEEQPAAPGSVTTTTSPAHASRVLGEALDNVFAQGLDERMMAAMPDFWKLYYAAVAARSDYKPQDPGVLRQSGVDEKARLTSTFEPQSNDFAQDAGVAGMCLYHTIIGADGKPGEISVARPIGFGLDENAVAAIRKASFQPAMKDGKPVPVVLDLVVQFRIYSKRTNVASKPDDSDKPKSAQLPGPYTLRDPPKEQQQNQ